MRAGDGFQFQHSPVGAEFQRAPFHYPHREPEMLNGMIRPQTNSIPSERNAYHRWFPRMGEAIPGTNSRFRALQQSWGNPINYWMGTRNHHPISAEHAWTSPYSTSTKYIDAPLLNLDQFRGVSRPCSSSVRTSPNPSLQRPCVVPFSEKGNGEMKKEVVPAKQIAFQGLPFEANREPNSVKNYDNHMMNKGFYCTFCDRIFSDASEFKTHLNNCEEASKRPHKCELCDRGFAHKKHLKRHMTTHLEMKLFFCELCGRGFRRKDNLKSHMKIHAKLRTSNCPKCSIVFPSKSELLNHLHLEHIVDQEKMFSCPL